MLNLMHGYIDILPPPRAEEVVYQDKNGIEQINLDQVHKLTRSFISDLNEGH